MENKKQTKATYADLLRSSAPKPPIKNKFWYNFFHPFRIWSILVVMLTAGGSWAGLEPHWSFAVTIFSILVIAIVNMYVYENMTGHGVGLRKKDGFSILGLSDSLSMTMSIFILKICLFLLY